MLQHVHSVLIGKTAEIGTPIDSMTKGGYGIFDLNKKEISAITADVTSIYIGVCKKEADPSKNILPVIEWSHEILRAGKPTFVVQEHEDPKEEEIEFDLSSISTITAGHRYVLRIIYKDLYEHPGQFSHTYELFAASGETATTLAQKFVDKINRHPNRRVNATVTGNGFTIEAMPKDDNEGVNSLNEYTVVSMDATLYTTNPSAGFLSNVPEVVGETTKTEGDPGIGYWKQVRDSERRYLGYKGHVLTGAYPSVEGAMHVQEDAEYNYIVIENENLFLSNDNQYIKNTPITTELYFEDTDSLSSLLTADGFARELTPREYKG